MTQDRQVNSNASGETVTVSLHEQMTLRDKLPYRFKLLAEFAPVQIDVRVLVLVLAQLGEATGYLFVLAEFEKLAPGWRAGFDRELASGTTTRRRVRF